MSVNAVLFDLDGTLLDTANDLLFAINEMRKLHALPATTLPTIKSTISAGSKAMLKKALGIEETDHHFNDIRNQFLDLYQAHIADSACFFPNMEKVLNHLEENNIPWGIVTNRITTHTQLLLKALQIEHRPLCIVCGDTLAHYKPHPAPILHACQHLKLDPKHCIYVGDAITDVMAGKAAGMRALVALYGYIDAEEDPYQWQADGYINEPLEILKWL